MWHPVHRTFLSCPWTALLDLAWVVDGHCRPVMSNAVRVFKRLGAAVLLREPYFYVILVPLVATCGPALLVLPPAALV